MKSLGGIFSILLCIFVAWPSFAETVRIRLRKSQSKIELSGLGLGVGLGRRELVQAGLPQVRKVSIELDRKASRWPVWKIRDGKQVQKLIAQKVFVEADTLRLGLDPVPNSIELITTSPGRMDVIATMDLEKYLTGVLPSEMPASWPVEALKAQVIASRSYAMALVRERKNLSFDLEATIFDQVFDMRNHIEVDPAVREKIARIVRETAGEVLLDAKGRSVKAHYHADCGGQTETARNVWGEDLQETGVTRDTLCPISPWAMWQYRIGRQQLRSALGVDIKSAATVGRTASGRVVAVDVVRQDGGIQRMTSHEFRQALGFKNLKSTNFKFFWQGDSLLVEGRGNGHGVGLCQYGARQLAIRGLKHEQILSNYYPVVKLGKLPARGIPTTKVL